ncbi:MAG: hypothetical protein KDB53_05145 [Planctomycetes bacterium]|nr:hypothetical protein [Planctomycetota bacterium]
MKSIASSLCCLVLILGSASAQLTQTLPAGFETTVGGTQSPLPFSVPTQQAWQWHYDSSQFAVQGPILITDVAVRHFDPNAPVNAFSFPMLEVTLIEASTHYAVGAHNTIFAANVLTSQVARSGPWTHAGSPAPGGATASWLSFGVTTPFIYDPSSGNDFIVQLRICGSATTMQGGLDMAQNLTAPLFGNRYGNLTDCASIASSFTSNEAVPIVQITYSSPSASDIQAVAIVSPIDAATDCGLLTASEAVSVEVRNLAGVTLPAGALIPCSYTLNGGAPVAENLTLPAALPFGGKATLTFSSPANLASHGSKVLTVSTAFPGDQNAANDTTTRTVRSGSTNLISVFPHLQDFDNHTTTTGQTLTPPGWRQDLTDATGPDADWFFNNTSNPAFAGPPADHTTGVAGQGFYALVSDAGEHAAVNLVSECFDLSSLASPAMSFWLFSVNPNQPLFENHLHIDVISYPGGTVTPDVVSPFGHVGNQWNKQLVSLAGFSGQTVQLQFRASSLNGGIQHPIAIDDVEVFSHNPGIGQAPRNGLASFNLNDATEGAGFQLTSGLTGPYFAQTSLSGVMQFIFEGEPNRPIVFLAGPLNPGAATFGSVGSMDIGSTLDPITGLPTQILLVANGFAPAFPDSFFRTDASGRAEILIGTPPLPLGVFTTFQAAIPNATSALVGLTNAVELTIVP